MLSPLEYSLPIGFESLDGTGQVEIFFGFRLAKQTTGDRILVRVGKSVVHFGDVLLFGSS